jgi:3-oxoacyl-[acyl-carrier protein] reductase
MSAKVAIVTGGTSGMGEATAQELVKRGWQVAVMARSKPHKEIFSVLGDVAQDADCRALAAAAVQRWGRIDALVNNAGVSVFGAAAAWDALDAEAFQRIYAVNTIGSFQMVRACLPQLKAAQGCVVNVSSIAGLLGVGSSVPYVASKGAMNAMTLHLARALAPEIRVNAVCPGMITSRWFVDGIGQEGYERLKANYEKSAPLGRPSTPEDVAEAVVWLVEGARTTTGELLLLDGGMHLGARPPAVTR